MNDNKPKAGGRLAVSRRRILGSAVSAGSLALLPVGAPRAAEAQDYPPVFGEARARTLAAFVDRLIPADANGPGALEAGAVNYINRALGDWNSAEVPELEAGLDAIDAASRRRDGRAFADLGEGERDALMREMDAGELGDFPTAGAVFNRLQRLTLEGMFSDPWYGGNRDYAGWDLIGYPGAVMASTPEMQRMGTRLPPLHTSAYGAEFDGE